MLEGQDDALRRLRIGRLGRLPVGRQRQALEAVVAEHVAQALGRAFRPGGEQHPLAAGRQGLGVVGGGLEEVDAVLGPFGGEGAAQTRAHVDDPPALARVEGREPKAGLGIEPAQPLLLGQVEGVRLQRPIMGPVLGVAAGRKGVQDGRQPLVGGLAGLMVDADQGRGGQEVEQGFQPAVEQRQVVLHAGPAGAFTDGGVERIVARGAEGLEIAGAEPGDPLGVEQSLRHRQEVDVVQLFGRALGLGIEGADPDSSVSPNRSRRTGSSDAGGNTSITPPRMANSPRSETVEAR